MNTTAEIYLWGTRIGIIHQDLDRPYASFEYDRDFRQSGIQVSPIMMPLSDIVYEFPSLSGEPFLGMPGLVADSLPDTFGNKVIEQWLVKQGRSIKEFSAIDRLCYTGKRGMGALEYVPASSEIGDINENINVSNNGDHGLEDVPEYTLIEFAYYKMALEAGVQMNECRLYSNNGEHHFMTKRFDRVAGKKIHMQSLGAIAHITYKEPRICSYEMAAAYMRETRTNWNIIG